MQNTMIDIPVKTRASLCDLLNKHLANAIDLQTQCKQAHWNVRGKNFYSLHLLFDKVNEDVEDYVDLIAERIAQLGGQAYGTIQNVAKTSALEPYPQDLVDSDGHVEALSNVLAAFANKVRKAVDDADKMNDQGTSDMFTEISRGVDSWLWMVESHMLGGDAGGNGNGTAPTRAASRLKTATGRR